MARNGDVLSYSLHPSYFSSARVSGAGHHGCGAEGPKAPREKRGAELKPLAFNNWASRPGVRGEATCAS